MAEEVLEPLIDTSCKKDQGYNQTPIGIIGTGNFAVALSKRLTIAGYEVVLGSRRPGSRLTTFTRGRDCMCGVKLTTIGDCINKCDVIFVAIHMEDFKITLENFAESTRDKILVDVSNREYRYAAHSNAEYLVSILPHANVVKSFNSISAYTMEDAGATGGNNKVFVAGNDITARSRVGDIAKSMGFRVVDLGGLQSARQMEEFVLKVFSHWKIPLFLTFGIFNLWCLYIVYIYFIEKTAYKWEQIFLKVLNKPLCMTAITVLALTYLPGHIASIYQIYYGTKHRRFPRILDTWLQSRKQFGLISFILVCVHALASAMMMSPTYYSSWFHKSTVTLPANATLTSDLVIRTSSSWMVWKGEAACLVGIAAFVLLAIIAVTSIPSVGEALNWSEWRCIHSKLSYMALVLSIGHVCIMGAPGWAKGGPYKTFRSITLLSILLPLLVLFLKFIFVCPPLNAYLQKIRRGWERNPLANSTDYRLLSANVESKTFKIEDVDETSKGVRLDKSCGCSNTRDNQPTCGPSEPGVFNVNGRCQCSAV